MYRTDLSAPPDRCVRPRTNLAVETGFCYQDANGRLAGPRSGTQQAGRLKGVGVASELAVAHRQAARQSLISGVTAAILEAVLTDDTPQKARAGRQFLIG